MASDLSEARETPLPRLSVHKFPFLEVPPSLTAVTTLLKIMIDPSSPPSCRVRAADSVLDHAAKAIELEDIEARLAALEREAKADLHRTANG